MDAASSFAAAIGGLRRHRHTSPILNDTCQKLEAEGVLTKAAHVGLFRSKNVRQKEAVNKRAVKLNHRVPLTTNEKCEKARAAKKNKFILAKADEQEKTHAKKTGAIRSVWNEAVASTYSETLNGDLCFRGPENPTHFPPKQKQSGQKRPSINQLTSGSSLRKLSKKWMSADHCGATCLCLEKACQNAKT